MFKRSVFFVAMITATALVASACSEGKSDELQEPTVLGSSPSSSPNTTTGRATPSSYIAAGGWLPAQFPSTTANGSTPSVHGWTPTARTLGLGTSHANFAAGTIPHSWPEAVVENSAAVFPWTSGRFIAVHDQHLWVSSQETGTVVILDRDSGKVLISLDVGAYPAHLVVGPDGIGYVASRHHRSVVRITPQSGGWWSVDAVRVGVDPYGLALDVDGKNLFVSLRGDGHVVSLDAETGVENNRVLGFKQPQALAFKPSGQLVVIHAGDQYTRLAVNQATGLLVSEKTTLQLRQTVPWSHQLGPTRKDTVHSNTAAAVTIEPSSQRAIVVHRQAVPGDMRTSFAAAGLDLDVGASKPGGYGGEDTPPSDSDGGNEVSLAPAVPELLRPIEAAVTSEGSADEPIDEPAEPVLDEYTGEPMSWMLAVPTDISHHPALSLAFVTSYGTDSVIVLNTAVDDPMRSPVGRIAVGFGPLSITFSPAGDVAYVVNGYEFSVSRIDLSPFYDLEPVDAFEAAAQPTDPFATHVKPVYLTDASAATFADDPLPSSSQREGRRIYSYVRNEALSHAGEMACVSCHGPDGSSDGLIWFPAEGPRQTPLLLGDRLVGTAPFNWLGTESSLENNMVQTIQRMGGQGLDLHELKALGSFLTDGLPPMPDNPHLRDDGTLTPQQKRGKLLFSNPEVGCLGCHVNYTGTDGKTHDVGTFSEEETILHKKLFPGQVRAVNTPSLRGVWASAPYLHDGSAKTLRDVLEKTKSSMGKTEHLTEVQLTDIVAFIQTL